ncbi:MAG: tRNA (N6-threonylcarbamoyladenosine(37)-N6)-methyltransferase TrmO [Firmicutes bacterium]|nr:tRNA (N6-threonylcarbamoyladenosine(37)-N6)-methyltransferase TrmO [Bacillota bacterium]
MEEIRIKPIGVVKTSVVDIRSMPMEGENAVIEVKEKYAPALQRIEENSHIWIICWFDRSERNVLQTMPLIMEPEPVKFGVFALRCYKRPNPLAITLVSLDRVEKNRLYVSGLDAVEGTPVLDIKPYYEHDSIFSPLTPYIKPKDEPVRRSLMHKLALRHHGKNSSALETGLRICLAAETLLGHLLNPAVTVSVTGSRELADVIQGITRARLANPPRFTFCEAETDEVIFTRDEKVLKFSVKKRFTLEELQGLPDEEIFIIKEKPDTSR